MDIMDGPTHHSQLGIENRTFDVFEKELFPRGNKQDPLHPVRNLSKISFSEGDGVGAKTNPRALRGLTS